MFFGLGWPEWVLVICLILSIVGFPFLMVHQKKQAWSIAFVAIGSTGVIA